MSDLELEERTPTAHDLLGYLHEALNLEPVVRDEPPVGNRVELREALHLSRRELANVLGMPEQSIAHYEEGRTTDTIGLGTIYRKFLRVAAKYAASTR